MDLHTRAFVCLLSDTNLSISLLTQFSPPPKVSALETLEELPGVPTSMRDFYAVDITKLIYSGHSNGGQGAWWLTGHYPDNAVAGISRAI